MLRVDSRSAQSEARWFHMEKKVINKTWKSWIRQCSAQMHDGRFGLWNAWSTARRSSRRAFKSFVYAFSNWLRLLKNGSNGGPWPPSRFKNVWIIPRNVVLIKLKVKNHCHCQAAGRNNAPKQSWKSHIRAAATRKSEETERRRRCNGTKRKWQWISMNSVPFGAEKEALACQCTLLASLRPHCPATHERISRRIGCKCGDRVGRSGSVRFSFPSILPSVQWNDPARDSVKSKQS